MAEEEQNGQSNPMSDTRHPMEQTPRNPTYTPPLVSCGKTERRVLWYLQSVQGDHSNIKGFSRDNNLPRSTVNDALQRLIQKGLADKPDTGHYIITEKGIRYLAMSAGGVGSDRGGCRTRVSDSRKSLSRHYARFTLLIRDRSRFYPARIKELNPLRYNPHPHRNFAFDYAYFEDATLTISKDKVTVKLHDILARDTEDAYIEGLWKAISYRDRLESIGLVSDTVQVEKSHWARVGDLLASALKRIDNRYYVEHRGAKLWIDNSTGPLERETDEELWSQRTDQMMVSLLESRTDWTDTDKLVTITGNLVKLEAMRLREQRPIEQPALPQDQTELRRYTG